MAITFECEGCGKAYTVGDNLAGKTGQCKQCGQRMTIPSEADSDGYGLDASEPEAAPRADSAPLPPRAFKPAPRPPLFGSPGSSAAPAAKKSFFGGSGGGGAVGVLVAVVLIGLRVYLSWDRAQGRRGRNVQPNNAMAPFNAGPGNVNPPRLPPVANLADIPLPNFPEPGPAREIEPGIMFREIILGPAQAAPGTPPGHGGKLWLYLPAGDHPAHSLPCVLITGAGSNLLTGMDLGDGDRPEHLPYVRAGFAVLAFELDGALANREQPTDAEFARAMLRFRGARAGLVNAHIAFEYALKKVLEIDPAKISVAGHSSAGTLAVLFAEHEPKLKACIAFAPALDLEKRFGPQGVAELRRAGGSELAIRYSPKRNEDKLQVPLFLFHARDDSNVPVVDSEAFAADLNSKGKAVTVDLVPTGDHYDSMINEGIPHAIAWLNEHGAGPNR